MVLRIWMLVCLALAVMASVTRADPPAQAGPVAPRAAVSPAAQAEYARLLQAWEAWMQANQFRSDRTNCKEFVDLVSAGPGIVPWLLEELRDDPARYYMVSVVKGITRTYYPAKAIPVKERRNDTIVKAYLDWWAAGSTGVSAEFERRYQRWKELRDATRSKDVLGRSVLWTVEFIYDDASKDVRVVSRVPALRTTFGDAYMAIVDVGIDALPLIVAQLKNGNYDLLPVFAEITGGQGVIPAEQVLAGRVLYTMPEVRAKAAIDWWEANRGKWEIVR